MKKYRKRERKGGYWRDYSRENLNELHDYEFDDFGKISRKNKKQ
ncbi:MAG: hypothetical protein AB7I18_02700 [Candidatus Berkiella sp.]